MTATDLANLEAIRSNLLTQLAAMEQVPPDSSIDGQSEQWTSQYVALTNQLKTLNELIAQGQPFAVRSRGRV